MTGKISQLPPAAELTGAELLEAVQEGDSVQTTVEAIVTKATTAAEAALNPMTAKGDLITGGLVGTPNRLGAGSAGTVLTSAGPNQPLAWAPASGAIVPATSSVLGGIKVGSGLAVTGDGTLSATGGGGGGSTTLAALTDVELSSPSNGQSLVYNSSVSKWENTTISGGSVSGSAAITSSPDNYPVSPTSFDDEFDGSAVSSIWTQQISSGATLSVVDGALIFSAAADGSSGADNARISHAIEQPIPTDPTWEFTAKVKLIAQAAYSIGGLWIRGASEAYYWCILNYSGTPTLYVGAQTWPTVTSHTDPFLASTDSSLWDNATLHETKWVYLSITFDGTNLNFKASQAGLPGTFQTLYSSAASALTPTDIGLCAISNSSSPMQLVCEWFRRTDVDYAVQSTVLPGVINTATVNPNSYPVAPTAWDDEFEETSLDTVGGRFTGANAWSWVNQLSSAVTFKNGSAMFTPETTSDGSQNASMITQPLPVSTTWKFRTKVSARTAASYNTVGMTLYETSSGKGMIFGFLDNGGTLNFWVSSLGTLTTNTPILYTGSPFSSAFWPFGASAPTVWVYLEISLAAGNLSFNYSLTGEAGSFTTFTTASVASYFTTAPDSIGLGGWSQNTATQPTLWADWFRRVDGAYALGGVRNGSPGNVLYANPIDAPPLQPDPFNDEFLGGTTLSSAWTLDNQTGTDGVVTTTRILPTGGLLITNTTGTNTTGNTKVLWKTLPTAPYDIVVNAELGGAYNYNQVGVTLYNSGSQSYATLRLVIRDGNPSYDCEPGFLIGSNITTTLGSEANLSNGSPLQNYLRVKVDGSGNATFMVSRNGFVWVTVESTTISALGFTPTSLGLWYTPFDSSGATNPIPSGYFRWVRNYGSIGPNNTLTVSSGLATVANTPSVAALNYQAGSYTAVFSDGVSNASPIASTSASATIVTIPGYGTGSGEVPWVDGATIVGLQLGTGQVTIAVSGGSTTLHAAHGTYTTYGQYAYWCATYVAANDVWVLGGDLS